jgi:hypothetical protein
MLSNQESQANALARWMDRFRVAVSSQPNADDLDHLEELAAILRGLRESPVASSAESVPAISSERLRELIPDLRFGVIPSGLDERVADVCAVFANHFASEESLASLELALREVLAPVDATDRQKAEIALRMEDERIRVKALEQLLDALNAFVATNAPSGNGELE